ncbi:MAG TPA: hypothetical protein VIL20_09440, partial [Sandaracinaceae bacterium]
MSDELDPVRRVLASITRRELGEDALFGVFGGDRPRVGAALWRLIEGGERLPSLESVPALLRLAPYDGHALLAYLRSLDAPKWARMGNRFSKGENFRGWHADLEALVRGCADRGALIESWSEIPDPVGGCVAFALARLGELDPTSLPSESLERFARAFAEVYDYDDGHLVFEGVERIGEPARFRRAVVEAAPAPGPEVLDLLCAAFLRPSEPSVRLALKLFARGNERVRDTVRVCLLTQPLELLAPHVATLLAGDAHHRALGAELVLRHSYAPAIRELARNHRTVDPAPSSSEALLAWAAELEPELEALLARTEGVDPPDELGAIDARDDAAFADALANHADPMAAALRFVLARPDRPAVARLAVRRFAPESRAFALALFKWVYCVPPPASSLGATIRSTVDGPLLHTPGP